MRTITTESVGRLAVVTGGSSGIGLALAHALAARGFDLLLVARDPEKLAAAAAELEHSHAIVASTLPADLSSTDGIATLRASISNVDVGVLVACAGVPLPGAFIDGDIDDYHAITTLKTTAILDSVRAVAPGMHERKRGAIMLVGSSGGLKGVPYVAVNSAAEGYVLNLGESLHHEFKPSGVRVTVLMPGPTDTPALRGMLASPYEYPPGVMTAAAVAAEGLRALDRGRVSHVAGTANRWMSRLLPRKVATRLEGVMTARLLARRSAAP